VDDITLSIGAASETELEELHRALLKARASELSEIKRLQLRHSAGYGDDARRESMLTEKDRAEMRHRMLSRLVEAVGKRL
jgi:hypothetical protein